MNYADLAEAVCSIAALDQDYRALTKHMEEGNEIFKSIAQT